MQVFRVVDRLVTTKSGKRPLYLGAEVGMDHSWIIAHVLATGGEFLEGEGTGTPSA